MKNKLENISLCPICGGIVTENKLKLANKNVSDSVKALLEQQREEIRKKIMERHCPSHEGFKGDEKHYIKGLNRAYDDILELLNK